MAIRTVKRIKKLDTRSRVGIVERRKIYVPGLLLLLMLIALSVILAFGLVLFPPEQDQKITAEETFTDRITDAIPRHRVQLGMSPEEVKTLYPNMSLRVDAYNQTLGTFFLDGAKHIVTFNRWLSGEKAYRIQYDKVFKTLEEEDVLRHFGYYYGRVAFDQCRAVLGQKEKLCQYHWKADGTKVVELYTRPTTINGNNHMSIRVVATDTYLDNKRRK